MRCVLAALFLALFSLTGNASAQIVLDRGIMVGATLTTVEVDEETARFTPDYRTGFVVGGFAVFDLLGPVKLRPEIHISQKGTRVERDGQDGSAVLSATYLEIPVLAKLSLPTVFTPHVSAGPAFAFRFLESAQGEGFQSGNLFRLTDLGVSFGAGLDFRTQARSFSIEVRYTSGLNNVLEGSGLGVNDFSKNRAFSITTSIGL
ncbi:MAG: porin family protein [Rhodothermales bacterium]